MTIGSAFDKDAIVNIILEYSPWGRQMYSQAKGCLFIEHVYTATYLRDCSECIETFILSLGVYHHRQAGWNSNRNSAKGPNMSGLFSSILISLLTEKKKHSVDHENYYDFYNSNETREKVLIEKSAYSGIYSVIVQGSNLLIRKRIQLFLLAGVCILCFPILRTCQ